MYDAANTPDRQDYLDDAPGYSFRELMAEFGVTDTDRTLAEASKIPAAPLLGLVAPAPHERVTLVACRRPADAVLLLDFGVPNDNATPGIFAGVLRSWEERFGVVPVLLDPGWTAFQVLAPPTTEGQIDRLAAEVFAFAADTAVQGGLHSVYGEPSLAVRELVQSKQWLIWWD